ncbi:MAG: diguanylate cyclase, partial [Candidatus Cloacimonetes bacterium]|nr:diguanylate cyclase [Candidatus Cloacimonadota bacterium]
MISQDDKITPNILIVDDDKKNLRALEAVLKKVDANIISANSGEKALELLMEKEYALVLLDVQMPGMDGFETAELMRQNKRLSKVPIIFVTAISKEDKYVQKGHEVGAIDYLFKPLDAIVLLSKVNIFLDYYKQTKTMQLMMDDLSAAHKTLEQNNKELNQLAHFDPVTGLANRLDFQEFLSRELSHAKRNNRILAVLLLDLDNFKQVNDTYGHQAGDELLKQVANRLHTSLREGDLLYHTKNEVLISRLGGDEFSVILSEIKKPEDAAFVAKRIISSLNKPFLLANNVEASIGVSIGIACYPLAGSLAKTLCKMGDLAMYNAKENGKNTYRFYSEKLNKQHRHHAKIEAGLKLALKQNLFYLVYQPIVDLQTLKTVGVEALCRCDLEALKEIPTEEFISVSEEFGLMPELGNWILTTVTTEAGSKLLSTNPSFSIHINLSPKQLQQKDFIAFVKASLNQLNAKQFVFELSESIMTKEDALLEKYFDDLHQIGVKISLDDF